MSHAAATPKNDHADPADTVDAVRSAWRRHLEVGADAARAFQAENAAFAGRLFDLNLEAARNFGAPGPGASYVVPFELGASALEAYLGYLGRSTALAQNM